MSQPNNTPNNAWYPTRILRIFYIVFAFSVLVGVLVVGYFIGNFIGMHMSVSDIQQGYAYSGLLYTIYNATHNPVYYQESQVTQGMGIAEGQTDLNSFTLIGLGSAIVADIGIAYLLVKEYEKMDS